MIYARLLSVAAIAIWSPAAADNDLLVLGYLENAQVGPTDLQMRAKLDTGADTSSLGYNRIHHFEKDGNEMGQGPGYDLWASPLS